MGIDLVALRAKLAAQKAAAGNPDVAIANAVSKLEVTTNVSAPSNDSSNSTGTVDAGGSVSTSLVPSTNTTSSVPNTAIQTVNAPATLGTSKTTEIEHLDFLSKMNSLAQAIHAQHPTMPVLLRQIHKQLRTDPELVTTLDEDAIGIIVRGLQIQTKTELVAEAVKKSSSGRTKKNPALSTDMF